MALQGTFVFFRLRLPFRKWADQKGLRQTHIRVQESSQSLDRADPLERIPLSLRNRFVSLMASFKTMELDLAASSYFRVLIRVQTNSYVLSLDSMRRMKLLPNQTDGLGLMVQTLPCQLCDGTLSLILLRISSHRIPFHF
jgi:hypothetical protein